MTNNAFKKLLGAKYPGLPIESWSDEIRISAEEAYDMPDGSPLADYYECSSWESYVFGVNGDFHAFLEKHGYFAEWINAGEFGIYLA